MAVARFAGLLCAYAIFLGFRCAPPQALFCRLLRRLRMQTSISRKSLGNDKPPSRRLALPEEIYEDLSYYGVFRFVAALLRAPKGLLFLHRRRGPDTNEYDGHCCRLFWRDVSRIAPRPQCQEHLLLRYDIPERALRLCDFRVSFAF